MAPQEGLEPPTDRLEVCCSTPSELLRHKFGTPRGTRTPNRPVRSRIFYPIELPRHVVLTLRIELSFSVLQTGAITRSAKSAWWPVSESSRQTSDFESERYTYSHQLAMMINVEPNTAITKSIVYNA